MPVIAGTTGTARLTVSRGGVVLARGTQALRAGVTATLKLKPTRAGRHAVRGRRRLSLVLDLPGAARQTRRFSVR